MPTYEYQCKSCNHRFEIWQKMIDEPLTVCPECNGTIRRVFFPAGIVFKGSGFYKTDHGSSAIVGDNHQNGQNGDKESASKDGASKAESASENKTSGASGKEKAESGTNSESKATAAAS